MASDAGAIAGGVLRRLASLGLAAAMVLAGCTSGKLPRLPRTQADLIKARQADQQQQEAGGRDADRRLLAGVKARYDASAVGRAAAPPVIDLLVISGGGDWGAFGAGFLKGWGRVAGPMARPPFDVVTGVSTGALIAPFAFLGDEPAIDRIVELYRNPRKEWFRPRGLLAFLAGGASYGEIPGLEKDIDRTLDETMMRRLVEAGEDGRLLAVSTSNLDFGEAHVWDLVAAFPPRLIDGSLYVDGAITGNIVYGGRLRAAKT